MNPPPIYVLAMLSLFVFAGAALWLIQGTEPAWRTTMRQSFPGTAKPEVPGEPIQPIPVAHTLDSTKVALGEKLFHDPRLSRDDTISCASCHDLAKGGTDRLPHSKGIAGAEGALNAPSVFNSGFNFVQFWDGRAATLEDQIDWHVHNQVEMGSNWPQIVAKLRDDQDYVAAFAEIYGTGVRRDNIKDAIATYERSLITPNSRFDRFLRGDASAINEREKAGYRLFKSYGCSSCHQGVNIGGNMYQALGIIGNYYRDRGSISKPNFGRFNITGRALDRFVFKVPSLRNVELTAPYFHDGSVESLAEAVNIMAKYGLGRLLSDDESALLVEFLMTLTGQYNGKQL